MVIGESSVSDERSLLERFSEEYRLGRAEIMREIERRVCGCDYGGTSWTTSREARRVAEMLALEPGKRLLEVGAGSGWPGLYLAATTGCDAVLVDLPLQALKIAVERAAADGLAQACRVAVADGAALPLRGGRFDAVLHSDVLCCLRPKLAVLNECRRVLRADGQMVFTVISISPGLARADYARAVAYGPPVVEAETDYPTMLRRSGWTIAARVDMTADYEQSVRRQLENEEIHADELRAHLGDAEYGERLTRRRNSLGAIEAGLIRRDLFRATPDPADGGT